MDPSTNDAPHSLGERFQVESRLGRGGSGDVYKAFDTMLERTVAVKVLRRENTEPEAGKRLLREARACARLSHPNIVTIHDVLQLDTGICIVMEHLDGSSLDSTDGGRTHGRWKKGSASSPGSSTGWSTPTDGESSTGT